MAARLTERAEVRYSVKFNREKFNTRKAQSVGG
jgi:hypothetical protein